MDDRAIGAAYGDMVERYCRAVGTLEQVHADDRALIGRWLGGRAGPIVDAGCGPGHLTAFLHDLGADVRGIDLVPGFVARARTNHPYCRFDVGSLRRLDAADRSLDGVLAWYSTIHLEPSELPAVLTEFRRVLAPSGVLVLGFFSGTAVESFAHKVTTAYRWPPAALADLLADSGLTVRDRLGRSDTGAHRAHGVLVASATAARPG